jgi:flagellar biogenesis protein FliO
VLAVIVVVAQLVRHRLPLASPSLPKEVVEPLGRCSLDAKRALHLVRCGSQILVLGTSAGGLRSLGTITDPAEVDRIAGQCRHARRPTAAQAFSSVFSRHVRHGASVERPATLRADARPSKGALDLHEIGRAGEDAGV